MRIAVPTDSTVSLSKTVEGVVLTIAVPADGSVETVPAKDNGPTKTNGGTEQNRQRRASSRGTQTTGGERLSEILKDIRVMDSPKVEDWLRNRIRKLARPSSRDKAIAALDLRLQGLRIGNEQENSDERKDETPGDPF